MPVWNSDVDSNETGAPFIRHIPFYIVVGNHDIGSTGVNANLIGTNTSVRFTGNQDGGDALVYFNNFYYPLNGPSGVDPEFTWNGDVVTDNGFLFQYMGATYQSPTAIEALRASTEVATAPHEPSDRQIDHMSNYSFENGNTHFLFLDANPHLFDAVLDGASVSSAAPDTFPSYPSILRKWIIDDLDASHQTWKVVVFHQPAFSSGNATLRNSQMRAIAKLLEDHGVNLVFNGHEHNYQRTLPLRGRAPSRVTPSGLIGGGRLRRRGQAHDARRRPLLRRGRGWKPRLRRQRGSGARLRYGPRPRRLRHGTFTVDRGAPVSVAPHRYGDERWAPGQARARRSP